MTLSDITLSKRLERAEGYACVQFTEARHRLYPDSRADWMECAGAYAAFDGVDSPITQTFGLGLFEELNSASLDALERFFMDRGAPVYHEVSPFAGISTTDLLCSRQYRPVEISNVLYMSAEQVPVARLSGVTVRSTAQDEARRWSEVSARGWGHEHPELQSFLLDFGIISAAREHSISFLAELDGKPGAAGVLSIHDGVALLGGSATVPELRGRGLQTALLQARIRYAHDHGCDLLMMVAEPGSASQRNAERQGFRIAYTRTKWKLSN